MNLNQEQKTLLINFAITFVAAFLAISLAFTIHDQPRRMPRPPMPTHMEHEMQRPPMPTMDRERMQERLNQRPNPVATPMPERPEAEQPR